MCQLNSRPLQGIWGISLMLGGSGAALAVKLPPGRGGIFCWFVILKKGYSLLPTTSLWTGTESVWIHVSPWGSRQASKGLWWLCCEPCLQIVGKGNPSEGSQSQGSRPECSLWLCFQRAPATWWTGRQGCPVWPHGAASGVEAAAGSSSLGQTSCPGTDCCSGGK